MPTIIPGAIPNGSFWPGEYSPSKYASAASAKGNPKRYDYVIVGGGTAGAVLANRLSADGKHSVLLLEAGYSDSRQLWSRIPAAFPFLFKKDADWFYETVPQPNLNNRRMFWPRGKMLGGCSSINALIYQRCSPDTYDEWAALGNEGWDWKSIEPYFEKSETHIESPDFPSSKIHHKGTGPWKTRVAPFTSPVSKAIIAAGDAMGVKKIDDIQNPETQIGSVRLQTIVDENGRRHSTNQAYLTKDVRKRKNLTIGVGVTTTKIILSEDGKTAVGVEFAQKKGAKAWVVHANKEVIISTGTINTPQLLMISGIGPREELEKHKIPVKANLPGVGQNLTDHLACGLIYYGKNKGLEYLKHEVKVGPAFLQWAVSGKGPLTSNIAESALFFRHEDLKGEEQSLDLVAPAGAPDLELLCAPVNYLNHALEKLPQRDAISLGAIHIQPTSRGTVTLKDASPWTHPLIDPKYLSTENDHRAMIFALKTALKLADTEPLASEIHSAFDFKKPESFAHFRGRGEFKDFDDATIDELFRDSAFTIYHPTGTAKMGPRSDVLAVVDSRLKVHGISGLRIVDASVMPIIVRGHPQAPVVAIAEKAADLILQDADTATSNGSTNKNSGDVAASGNDNLAATALVEKREAPAFTINHTKESAAHTTQADAATVNHSVTPTADVAETPAAAPSTETQVIPPTTESTHTD